MISERKKIEGQIKLKKAAGALDDLAIAMKKLESAFRAFGDVNYKLPRNK